MFVDRHQRGFILFSNMLPKILLSEKPKAAPALFGLIIILGTFFIFYLDLITRDLIAFDVFYFPSIMLTTWYLRDRSGFLMVIFTAFLWSLARMDAEFSIGMRTLLLDGAVHFSTFTLVFWLTHLVHEKAMLLESVSKELARSNQELELFAAKAAHDLQSPLATILDTEIVWPFGRIGAGTVADWNEHSVRVYEVGAHLLHEACNASIPTLLDN